MRVLSLRVSREPNASGPAHATGAGDQRKRAKQFNEQLEMVLRMMSSGLRVGLGVRQALVLVTEDVADPARVEFARAVGEYGSVVFISGNMPMRTEITPLLIITKLDQYDYAGATAIAVVMLVVSFVLLLAINLLQKWSSKAHRGESAAEDSAPGKSLEPIYVQTGG